MLQSFEHTCDTTLEDKREVVQVTPAEVDDYQLYCVFRRKFIGQIDVAKCVVSVNSRAKQMKQGLRTLLNCSLCAGRVMNVGLCNHEKALLNEICSTNRLENGPELNHTDSNDDAIFNEHSSSEDEYFEEKGCINEMDYQSKLKRNIFPCTTEKQKMINTLLSVIGIARNRYQNSGDSFFLMAEARQ